MTLIIPHHKTEQEAIKIIDRGANDLFAGVAAGAVEIVDQKKEWNGSTMTFSFTGRLGFISVPLSGTILVDDRNVTVKCELPAMVKNFIGEDKVGADIEGKIRRLVTA
jgi:hypothetical protein